MMKHPLEVMHDHARARFGKLNEAKNLLDKVRVEMDKLVDLGDMVAPEDVTKVAGKLVGHGLSAPAVAQLLTDMPNRGGEALQAWVQQHDAGVRQREAQLAPAHAVARHEMGIAGIRLLAGHANGLIRQGDAGVGSSPSSNPMMPQTIIERNETPGSGAV